MRVVKNVFSFTHVTDPTYHRTFNEWHHLDHRPQILAIPGVHWGERWVLSPDCADFVTAREGQFTKFNYMTMYWLCEPIRESADEFSKVSLDCFHWGRHPELEKVERSHVGWADPVRGYVARRVMMAPEVLPLRPHRGVHVTVSRFRSSIGPVHEALLWYNANGMPDLVETEGVLGAWTFVATPGPTDHVDWRTGLDALRFRVVWLNEDPVAWTRTHPAEAQCQAPIEAGEEVLFAGPLRAISAFDYDWFDQQV